MFAKNRRDHYLPQGYLKGFIDPTRATLDRPLWCFDIARQRWRQKATKEVGAQRGFYDFAGDLVDVEHPDVTFKSMEDAFPPLLKDLVASGFEGWEAHLPFLCNFMQMIRARSPLYFAEKRVELAQKRISTVTAVEALTDEDKRGSHRVTVDSMEGRKMTPAEIRNMSLGNMRDEIKAGAGWMAELHWTLRFTKDVNSPVIAAEQPLTMRNESRLARADDFYSRESYFFFPLCWQACLVGNRLPFANSIQPFASDKLRAYRAMVFQRSTDFVVSPQPISR